MSDQGLLSDSRGLVQINPREIYTQFGDLDMDSLRGAVGELLSSGVTVVCGDTPVTLQTSYILKSGRFKDIYLLNALAVGAQSYDPDEYVLKVRFMANTDTYWENESKKFPDRGAIPLEMSEGHRYTLLAGELDKLFARVVPMPSYVLLQTRRFVVDFIVQERMTTSLDILRRNAQLSAEMIFCFMYRMIEMVRSLAAMNYTFTNFSPTSVMLKVTRDGWVMKLMNLSFLQREGDMQIGTNHKLLTTASREQLRGDLVSSTTNMLWNVIFTVFDLFRPKSYLDDIRERCCLGRGDECLLNQMYQNRRAEVDRYMNDTTDNDEAVVTIRRVIEALRTNDPVQSMLSLLAGYYSASNRAVHDLVLSLIARKMLFNDAGRADYKSMNPYKPECRDGEMGAGPLRAAATASGSAGKYADAPEPSASTLRSIERETAERSSDEYRGPDSASASYSVGTAMRYLEQPQPESASASYSVGTAVRNLEKGGNQSASYSVGTAMRNLENAPSFVPSAAAATATAADADADAADAAATSIENVLNSVDAIQARIDSLRNSTTSRYSQTPRVQSMVDRLQSQVREVQDAAEELQVRSRSGRTTPARTMRRASRFQDRIDAIANQLDDVQANIENTLSIGPAPTRGSDTAAGDDDASDSYFSVGTAWHNLTGRSGNGSNRRSASASYSVGTAWRGLEGSGDEYDNNDYEINRGNTMSYADFLRTTVGDDDDKPSASYSVGTAWRGLEKGSNSDRRSASASYSVGTAMRNLENSSKPSASYSVGTAMRYLEQPTTTTARGGNKPSASYSVGTAMRNLEKGSDRRSASYSVGTAMRGWDSDELGDLANRADEMRQTLDATQVSAPSASARSQARSLGSAVADLQSQIEDMRARGPAATSRAELSAVQALADDLQRQVSMTTGGGDDNFFEPGMSSFRGAATRDILHNIDRRLRSLEGHYYGGEQQRR